MAPQRKNELRTSHALVIWNRPGRQLPITIGHLHTPNPKTNPFFHKKEAFSKTRTWINLQFGAIYLVFTFQIQQHTLTSSKSLNL
jgi:hypothetical protein